MAPWNTVSKFIACFDLQAMVVFAAVGEAAVKSEAVTPDELIIVWCLFGGSAGSFASLHFYPPKEVAKTVWDAFTQSLIQFIINVSCAGIFSPFACEYIAKWLGFPLGLRLALPVSFIVGFFACQAIARGLPFLQQWFDNKGKRFVADSAMDLPALKDAVIDYNKTTTARDAQLQKDIAKINHIEISIDVSKLTLEE